jgi:hypothetical protein
LKRQGLKPAMQRKMNGRAELGHPKNENSTFGPCSADRLYRSRADCRRF